MEAAHMWVWLALVACQGDTSADSGKDDGPSPAPTADTGTPVGTEAPVFTAAPAWERNEAGARLMGAVTFQTDRPTSATVQVDDGGRTWTYEVPELSVDHRVQVMGLRSEATHTFTVTVQDAEGEAAVADPLTFTTDVLPDDFPPYSVESDPSRMEPGLTLVALGPYVTMLDAEGEPRWYLPTVGNATLVGITPDDTLLLFDGRATLVEHTLDGAQIGKWRAARTVDEPKDAVPVDMEALHHDAIVMPNGNLLALSIERRLIIGYPSSATDELAPPQDAYVAGDVVVEFQRDGTVVHEYRLLDLIDPTRIGYDALSSGHWESFYGGEQALDWSHGNAVWFDPDRDEVLVSLRHQDAVVAIDHASGELAWIFAPDANWDPPWDAYVLQPAVDMLLAYHQHGAKLTPDGHLMMFDNGNNRASAYENKVPDRVNVSRGIAFSIDHKAGTYDIVQQVGPELEPPLFSGSLGDADPMVQTGNMLVTFGNVGDEKLPATQIIEATNADPPEVVFHLSIERPIVAARSERVQGIVPGF